jgi:hypothetical protein
MLHGEEEKERVREADYISHDSHRRKTIASPPLISSDFAPDLHVHVVLLLLLAWWMYRDWIGFVRELSFFSRTSFLFFSSLFSLSLARCMVASIYRRPGQHQDKDRSVFSGTNSPMDSSDFFRRPHVYCLKFYLFFF